MAATIARQTVKAPEPIPADRWSLYLKVATSMYPEISPASFRAGRQEVVSVLSQGPPR